MLSGLVQQSTGRFDRRFYLNALVPTAVFGPMVAVTILQTQVDVRRVVVWYSWQTVSSQLVLAAAFASLIWLFASIVAGQWNNVVRLYEGYPLVDLCDGINNVLRSVRVPGPFRLNVPGAAAHRGRLVKLASSVVEARSHGVRDPKQLAMLHERYPTRADRVLPTSLGNRLRAAEDYGVDRYSFDTVNLWPRLASVVPDSYLEDVEKAQLDYQNPLVISFWSLLLGLSSLAWPFSGGVSSTTFLVVFGGSLVICWASYRMALNASVGYCDLLKAAVDLYRNELIERWWPDLLQVPDDRARAVALRSFVLEGRSPVKVHGLDESRNGQLFVVGRGVESDESDGRTIDRLADSARPILASRLSFLAVAMAVCLGVIGAQRLDEPVAVVVAVEDIEPFKLLIDRVSVEKRPRGEVPLDALAVAGDLESLQSIPSELVDMLALRRLGRSEIVRSADVGPAGGNRGTGIVIESEVTLSMLAGAQLSEGETVSVLLPTSSDQDGCDGPTLAQNIEDSSIDATILSIGEHSQAAAASVALLIDASAAGSICTAHLDDLAIFRKVD